MIFIRHHPKLKNYLNLHYKFSDMKIELRIDEVLKEKKMSQVELARKINKSKITINYWCSNKNFPSLVTLSEIAQVLKVKVSDLIKE